MCLASCHTANGATDKGFGIGDAGFKASNRAFFWVAHSAQFIDDSLFDGLFAREADQLFFAVNHQIGNLSDAIDALDDGVLAATAFDVLNFYLESLCHDMSLCESPQ